MKLKGINDYDICNYKKPAMFLIFPYCSFKCDKECGEPVCQNSALACEPVIEVKTSDIVDRYMHNPLTHAIVCGGLEPFDSKLELLRFISLARMFTHDPIVIYTGYKEEELQNELKKLREFDNIIVKFGRFIPDSPHIFDTVLEVELASNNQYAKYIGVDNNEYSGTIGYEDNAEE